MNTRRRYRDAARMRGDGPGRLGVWVATQGNRIGKAWNKDSGKKPIAAAVAAAELPISATAYTLRHSTITDLVSAGLPLLTIAQISGTSVEMIEKHYGHLVCDAAVIALGKLAV